MDKLLSCFKAMVHLLTQINLSIHAAEKIKEESEVFRFLIQFDGYYSRFPADLAVGAVLYNQALLLSCSMLDEFHREFTIHACPEWKNRIIKFKRQIRPVTKRIAKWTDLKTYRNEILAHPLRIEGQSIFEKADKSLKYNIPFTNREIKLLCELLGLITKNIGVEFPELRDRLVFTEIINDKIVLDFTEIDFDAEFQAVCEEIKMLGLAMT
ncbi:hypothetical protein [Spirosoma jeollabukense]